MLLMVKQIHLFYGQLNLPTSV